MNLAHPLELISNPVDGRILEALSGADAAFTGRQVHRLVGTHSASGVQAGLDRLRRQGIVIAQPAGRAVLLGMKTAAGDGQRPVSAQDQARAARRAKQLVDAARQRA